MDGVAADADNGGGGFIDPAALGELREAARKLRPVRWSLCIQI